MPCALKAVVARPGSDFMAVGAVSEVGSSYAHWADGRRLCPGVYLPRQAVRARSATFLISQSGKERAMKPSRFLLLSVVLAASVGWAQYGAPRYTVVRAAYGSGSSFREVTSQVMALIRNNQLSFQVTNAGLGGDPAPGRVKQLQLQVRSERGDVQTMTFNENDFVSLAIANNGGNGWGGGGYPGASDLRILRAEYGVGERLVDVTNRLNSQIRNGQLSLLVNNDTMGRDPAEDHRKQLTVWYLYNGRTAQITVPEKSVITLPTGNPSYLGNLRIMRAQYGADYRFRDVPDRRKILTVSYVFNGQPGKLVVNEKDTLTLPGAGGGWNGSWPGGGGQLQIMRARFGAGDRNADVTGLVSSAVQDGTVNLPVARQTM